MLQHVVQAHWVELHRKQLSLVALPIGHVHLFWTISEIQSIDYENKLADIPLL